MQVSASCRRDPAPLQTALREAYQVRPLGHPNNTLISLAQTASLKQPAHANKFHKSLLRGAFLLLPEHLACLGT